MSKTILITGASTGIGRSTALLFQSKGWNVIATMRNPEKEEELTKLDNVLVTRLDVQDLESIHDAVSKGLEKFNKIDVLLNNAGYGAYGILEATPREKIERQFGVNVIGLYDVTKAIIPHFRKNKDGIIINISSIGGKVTFPLGSLYHATKFAVEGLSESLNFELGLFGAKVKIVEPGMVNTDFGSRSFDFTNDESLTEYQELVSNLYSVLGGEELYRSEPEQIAEVIYTAATDGKDQIRYEAGSDAVEIIGKRKERTDEHFIGHTKEMFGLS